VSNSVEIVVEGKNEATKVFQQVESSAVGSATKVEQAWSKSMDSVNASIERGGFGATEAGGGFNRMKESAKGAGDEVEHMSRRSEEGADRLNRLGEASDNVDTRAMGFRDTVTGVSDTLKGLNDSSLSTEQRLFTLGAGIGDLGSAGYNLLVPAMSKAKEVISAVGDSSSSAHGKVVNFAKGAGIAAAALAVLAIGGRVANEIWGDDKVANIQNMTLALGNFAKTGQNGGESARILGGNFSNLKTSMDQLDDPSWWKAIKQGVESFTGTGGLSDAVTLAKSRVGDLDQSLAALAQTSPEQARAAFQKLTQDMGLSAQKTEELRQQLPQYKNAMDQADQSTRSMADGTRVNTQELSNYLTQLQAATDPVFGLMNALGQVTQAQTGYNDAVKQHGINSNEAKDASVALAEAVAGAEAAALNGQLSYSDFSAALDHWTQSGAITAQQARDIRGRVDEARGAAQAYTGNYDARLFMENHASNVIAQVKRDLDAVPDSTYKKFYMQYINQIIGNAPAASPPGFGFIGHNAHGGPIGHAATGGGRTGLTWVGEQGPELVQLPTGSMVSPTGASSAQGAGGGSGGGGVARVSIDLSGVDTRILDWLRDRIRIDGGGDVQVALGQR
jgi:polyhydroxyalkanoate synthesis regulator phasin